MELEQFIILDFGNGTKACIPATIVAKHRARTMTEGGGPNPMFYQAVLHEGLGKPAILQNWLQRSMTWESIQDHITIVSAPALQPLPELSKLWHGKQFGMTHELSARRPTPSIIDAAQNVIRAIDHFEASMHYVWEMDNAEQLRQLHKQLLERSRALADLLEDSGDYAHP